MKQKGKWFFDTKVGREEILNRRIGANELNAIQICRGFVEAQHEYAVEKHDGSKVNQYAQRIISSPGKHDGLAWQNADGTWGGPVGEEVAKALEQGYTERVQPYHGYYFKVLKGQGPAAPMGEMDFVVGGAMIGGFALAAAPAEYRVTGVMTFIVGPDGVVYEKDLGPDTLKTFQSMDKYNPDKTWKVTEDDVEDDQRTGFRTATTIERNNLSLPLAERHGVSHSTFDCALIRRSMALRTLSRSRDETAPIHLYALAWIAAALCATWAFGALYFDFPKAGPFAAILFVIALLASVIFVRGKLLKLGIVFGAFALVAVWWLTLKASND